MICKNVILFILLTILSLSTSKLRNKVQFCVSNNEKPLPMRFPDSCKETKCVTELNSTYEARGEVCCREKTDVINPYSGKMCKMVVCKATGKALAVDRNWNC